MYADIDFGDVLWTLLLVYLMVMYFVLVFTVIFDIFRDGSLGGVTKALWLIALLVLPFLSLFAYLITRGRSMGARSAERAAQEQAATDAYIRSAAASAGGLASELEKAAALRDAGKISDVEYEALKAKLLA